MMMDVRGRDIVTAASNSHVKLPRNPRSIKRIIAPYIGSDSRNT